VVTALGCVAAPRVGVDVGEAVVATLGCVETSDGGVEVGTLEGATPVWFEAFGSELDELAAGAIALAPAVASAAAT
jgi:hypothetical protein